MRYSPVRYHLLEEILNDATGSWTIHELTELVSTKVKTPAGGVQDSLYLLMAHNLLEAVPYQEHLTLRLRTDPSRPLTDTATAVEGLTALLAGWRAQYGSVADHLPDLSEGGDPI